MYPFKNEIQGLMHVNQYTINIDVVIKDNSLFRFNDIITAPLHMAGSIHNKNNQYLDA